MEVSWDRLDPRLQCVDGLDDIMRFDLQHFCRRMQPPQEPHYRSAHPCLTLLCAASQVQPNCLHKQGCLYAEALLTVAHAASLHMQAEC